MSEEKEQSAEEIMEEMQQLMKRQMELQAKLLKSNWNGFNDALGAFMGMFSDLQNKTGEKKSEDQMPPKKDEELKELLPEWYQANWELGDYTEPDPWGKRPYYPSGPVCKVVWYKDGREYEKEYSCREHALEKQKSLLLKKIPAHVKAC